MHELQGLCLSHLTFRSEQRMQAKGCFVGDLLDEEPEGFMKSGELREAPEFTGSLWRVS